MTVTVTDQAAFRARQSAWHRLLLRINGPMSAGDILIPDDVLPMSPRSGEDDATAAPCRPAPHAQRRHRPTGLGSR